MKRSNYGSVNGVLACVVPGGKLAGGGGEVAGLESTQLFKSHYCKYSFMLPETFLWQSACLISFLHPPPRRSIPSLCFLNFTLKDQHIQDTSISPWDPRIHPPLLFVSSAWRQRGLLPAGAVEREGGTHTDLSQPVSCFEDFSDGGRLPLLSHHRLQGRAPPFIKSVRSAPWEWPPCSFLVCFPVQHQHEVWSPWLQAASYQRWAER